MDKKKKMLMITAAATMVLIMAGVAGYYWYMKTHYVVTDDARIDGTIVSVSTQITGKITDIYVQEGDMVNGRTKHHSSNRFKVFHQELILIYRLLNHPSPEPVINKNW